MPDFVELRDQTKQLLLCGLLGKCVLLAVKAALLAGALLIADVNLARRIVADDNNRQTRRYACFFSASVSARMLPRTFADSALPSILTALMLSFSFIVKCYSPFFSSALSCSGA